MSDNKYFDLIGGYIQRDDNSKNNANFVYSLPTLNSILSWAIAKDFWFDEVYKDYKWISARSLSEEGWIYFHNMSILWPYCAWFSAKDIATLGLNSNASNNIFTRAPKYYRSLLDQCANFIAVISQEIHWACAINDLTAIVASYLWYTQEVWGNKIEYHDVVNAYESFIYAVNTPFRAGNSPFTNITMNFDRDPHLQDEYVVVGWEMKEKKYKELDAEYLKVSNKAFIDALKKWDAKGKPFTFPLITVNIYDDFDWENETFNYLLDNMDNWGGCYFENYRSKPFEDSKWREINKYIEPRDAASQKSFCCRLRINFEDILQASGWSSFRANAGVWGVGVFNINLNKIAYISKKDNGEWDREIFYKYLDTVMESAEDFAQKRRNFIEEHKELYPYFFYYNKSLDSFFNILSIVGWEEAIINIWYKEGLKDPEWRKIAHEIAEYIVDKINYFMKRDRVPVSLEFAPSENWWPTLAKKDIEFVEKLKNWKKSQVFPDSEFKYQWEMSFQWDNSAPFLTSGFQPPYNEKNIGAQTQISAEFQAYATGGSIQHFFLWEKLPKDMKKRLIDKTFEKPVMYMTLTPTITTCWNCHQQMVGEHLFCPECGSKDVQVASRIIWYLKPISGKNIKKGENVFEWEENFWQDARRADWSSRKQTLQEDIDLLLED